MNVVIEERVKELIETNDLVVLRSKKDNKALGVAYTEDGLKSIANKLGIYIYCKGRVNNYARALQTPINDNVYVEKFIPRDFENNMLAKCEIHWVNAAKYKLYNQSKY